MYNIYGETAVYDSIVQYTYDMHVCTHGCNNTSDMQGMVWGEPERGSAQNGVWKCDGDDSSHDSISSVSIASVIQH